MYQCARTMNNITMDQAVYDNHDVHNPEDNGAVATNGNPSNNATNNIFPITSSGLLMHPLKNSWTLWYLEMDRTKSWEELQREIATFNSVEDFWKLYSHIHQPSQLKIGSDYSLFKSGIRPMWEDPQNKSGGRWVITLSPCYMADLDRIWLDVILCIIGGALNYSEHICGAVVNIRQRINKISIWTMDGKDQQATLDIGANLKMTLHLHQNSLQYYLHEDAINKPGSAQQPIYTL